MCGLFKRAIGWDPLWGVHRCARKKKGVHKITSWDPTGDSSSWVSNSWMCAHTMTPINSNLAPIPDFSNSRYPFSNFKILSLSPPPHQSILPTTEEKINKNKNKTKHLYQWASSPSIGNKLQHNLKDLIMILTMKKSPLGINAINSLSITILLNHFFA